MKFGTVTQTRPLQRTTVKISNFSKSKMAAAAILKITKIAISQQRFDRSLQIWYPDAKWTSLPLRPSKKLTFTNPRWRTAAILKTVKLPYLCNRLTEFDEICYGDSNSPLTADRIFENPKWQRPLY